VSPTLDRLADDLFGSIRLGSVYHASPTFDSRAKRLDASAVILGPEPNFGQTNARVGHFL